MSDQKTRWSTYNGTPEEAMLQIYNEVCVPINEANYRMWIKAIEKNPASSEWAARSLLKAFAKELEQGEFPVSQVLRAHYAALLKNIANNKAKSCPEFNILRRSGPTQILNPVDVALEVLRVKDNIPAIPLDTGANGTEEVYGIVAKSLKVSHAKVKKDFEELRASYNRYKPLVQGWFPDLKAWLSEQKDQSDD